VPEIADVTRAILQGAATCDHAICVCRCHPCRWCCLASAHSKYIEQGFFPSLATQFDTTL